MSIQNCYGEQRSSLQNMLNSFCDNGLTQKERKMILEPNSNSNDIPQTFELIAKCILCGCFSISNEKSKVLIVPTAIEFYYHEESDTIKDEIVYHKNTNRLPDRPFFKLGFFNSHDSGIDLTFESPKEKKNFRASVLIREFKVIGGTSNDVLELKEIDGRSTYFRKALLSQFSVFDGFTISWEDFRLNQDQWDIKTDTRVGVKECNEKRIDKIQAIRPWKCSLIPKSSND